MDEQKTPEQEEQRREWRTRKQAQRAREHAFEEEQKSKRTDPADLNIERTMAAIAREDKSKYGPGVQIPLDDPEKIKHRSDAFDREKQRCEQKVIEESKRTRFALVHGLPAGWVGLFIGEFPPELR